MIFSRRNESRQTESRWNETNPSAANEETQPPTQKCFPFCNHTFQRVGNHLPHCPRRNGRDYSICISPRRPLLKELVPPGRSLALTVVNCSLGLIHTLRTVPPARLTLDRTFSCYNQDQAQITQSELGPNPTTIHTALAIKPPAAHYLLLRCYLPSRPPNPRKSGNNMTPN